MTADVVIAGNGIIGLCAALALADRKLSVSLIGEARVGEASRAAAGMLAPSVERAQGAAHRFGVAARDRYPSYLDSLAERTGMRVALNRRGILQVALSEKGIEGLRRAAGEGSSWLDRDTLASLEPGLSHALGAVHNPEDGSVDNVALVLALATLVASTRAIEVRADRIVRVAADGNSITATTAAGATIWARAAVIAAGAWSGQIDGARFARSVTPAKGQLVAYPPLPLGHVAYGPRGYLVPRGESIIGGSTMEQTGFDSSTSVEGLAKVRAASEEILPALRAVAPVRGWAGLRPVTPDSLPLIGSDPELPSLIYACGHGRNGILMGPLTGDVVADLVTGSPLRHDLAQFRPDRF